MWKVKQTAGKATVGQPTKGTHLPRMGWPFPASHHVSQVSVSTCPAVTQLSANLTPPSREASFLSASSSGQAVLFPGTHPLPLGNLQVTGRTEDMAATTGQGTSAVGASRVPFPDLTRPPSSMLALL